MSWLPFPLRSLTLMLLWLLLNQTVHPAHLLLGAVIGLAVPPMLASLWPRDTVMRRPLVALRLLGVFLRDVVVANVEVARRILGPEAAIHSRFVWMPLTIESQQGKAVLAAMVTMTPGTLSVDITEDGRWLLVHAFNLDDEQALIAEIRQRYEAPLREIFR